MTNYLDLMPEEILTIIYKFVNDDIIKDLKGNHGKNTYRPIYEGATLLDAESEGNKIFNGLRKTNYNDGHIIRDHDYGYTFENIMANHYVCGHMIKTLVNNGVSGCMWNNGGFKILEKSLALPTFCVNELQRCSPYMIDIFKF